MQADCDNRMTVSTTNVHLVFSITFARIIRRRNAMDTSLVGIWQGTNLKVPFALKEVKQVRDERCKSSVFSCSHDTMKSAASCGCCDCMTVVARTELSVTSICAKT